MNATIRHGVGASQSSGRLGLRTALGLRTQKHEIKYKKPTSPRGVSKSLRVSGAQNRTGLSERFFSRGSVFQEAPRKEQRRSRAEAESLQSVGAWHLAGLSRTGVLASIYFSDALGPPGGQKSGICRCGTGKSVFFAAELAESFFRSPRPHHVRLRPRRFVFRPGPVFLPSEKTPRNSGWGRWS